MARSRGPIRQRAPVSSRISAPPASGRPAPAAWRRRRRPRASSAGRRARRSRPASPRLVQRLGHRRHLRTAPDQHGRGALARGHGAPTRLGSASATHAASSSTVSVTATATRPRLGAACAGRKRDACASASRSGAATAFAAARIARSLRKLVASGIDRRRVAGRRAGRCVSKRADVAARSPRASRRSTGTGRRPQSPGARRRTGRAASRPARDRCPGTRRAARRGTAPRSIVRDLRQLGQLRGQRHLVGEVDRARPPLGRCEGAAPAAAARGRCSSASMIASSVPLGQSARAPLRRAAARGTARASAVQNRSTSSGRPRWSANWPRHRDHASAPATRRVRNSLQSPGQPRDDLVGELPRHRRRDQPGVGLGAEPQRRARRPAGRRRRRR